MQKLLSARDLAIKLMDQHGLRGWVFRFNRRKRAMGLCVAPRGGRPGRIELSIYFVEKNSDAEILDTILHEIAHALVGSDHGHDAVWQAKCLEIGAVPKRCGMAEMPIGSWRAVCPTCQKNFHRHRRPAQPNAYFCRTCGPERGRIAWKKYV